jgi:multicomponent Na+:H+ antiporter subunit B
MGSVSGALAAAVVVSAFACLGRGAFGLPPVGEYPGPYGDTVVVGSVRERHVPEAVTAVVFDYRGFDTMAEETILFTALIGLAALLRRDGPRRDSGTRRSPFAGGVLAALRPWGPWTSAALFVFGCYTVLHGHLSPGGGFQGGVMIANAVALAALCARFPFFAERPRSGLAHAAEALGVAGYALLGLGCVLAGGAFLQNRLPLGVLGAYFSGGTLPALNLASGLAVTGAFIRLFRRMPEDLQERGPGPWE